jgi:hypothetical protein
MNRYVCNQWQVGEFWDQKQLKVWKVASNFVLKQKAAFGLK